MHLCSVSCLGEVVSGFREGLVVAGAQHSRALKARVLLLGVNHCCGGGLGRRGLSQVTCVSLL
jgi:hypothetical protein